MEFIQVKAQRKWSWRTKADISDTFGNFFVRQTCSIYLLWPVKRVGSFIVVKVEQKVMELSYR